MWTDYPHGRYKLETIPLRHVDIADQNIILVRCRH